MLRRVAEPSGGQQRAELVAVQPCGVRLIVQARAADMRSWRMVEQVFLHRVLVEPGDRAQAAGNGGPGPAAGLQVAGEAPDAGPARSEQADVMTTRASGGD